MEISIDLSVTWKNVRCPVTVDPDMCMEISIDLLLTRQNKRCLVTIDPYMCMEISTELLLTWQDKRCSVTCVSLSLYISRKIIPFCVVKIVGINSTVKRLFMAIKTFFLQYC